MGFSFPMWDCVFPWWIFVFEPLPQIFHWLEFILVLTYIHLLVICESLKGERMNLERKKGLWWFSSFFFVSLIWCGGFDIWESCDEWCGAGIWNTKKYQLVELQIDWMISRTTPRPHKLRHCLEETMENQGPQKSQDAFIENRSKHSTYQWKP